MATIAGGLNLSAPRIIILTKPVDSPKVPRLNHPWRRCSHGGAGRLRLRRRMAAVPESLEDKVVESIKNAEETCSDDPASGECVAAWDEVEELSAAASHARDKKKGNSDPLENFCKDNPEDEECRTYDN